MQTQPCFDATASIVTRGPGRLRIAVPRLYRSHAEGKKIETMLSACKDIDAVYANPLTGKVLILFNFSTSPDSILIAIGFPVSFRESRDAGKEPAAVADTGRKKMPQNTEARRHDIYPAWHLREAAAALTFHGSSPYFGLSTAVADERLRHGHNLLPKSRGRTSLDILLGQFKSLPVLLLGVSAALSVLTGGISEGVAIAAVLALNAGIGFASERRAESTIASLSELVDDSVPVIRDGRLVSVPASHVVIGDVLVLGPGVRVAADARLVQASGLAADESALTGESDFTPKDSAALHRQIAMADRRNMVYMGTAVAAGSGLAVVVGTGSNTEIGVIQHLMESTQQPKTPIQKQLDRLGDQLVTASVGICAGVFAIGLVRGFGWLQMLKASISLAIAAVPEGLPTVATTSLARGVRLMRDKQMLVRRLQAVETLGAVHTICLDKTGTLTMNHMSVVEVQTAAHRYDTSAATLDRLGDAVPQDAGLCRLLQTCVLCNEEEASNNGLKAPAINGSSTEKALLEIAQHAGIPVSAMRERYPLQQVDLRAENRNYMKTVRALPGSDGQLVAVKGSPVEVLDMCAYCQCGEQAAVPLTQELRDRILQQNERMAGQQLRVLGFAHAEGDMAANGNGADDRLTWLGLAGLADPLRAGAQQVIAALHDAGIRTAMVTGDQSTTAYAIGRSLQLNNGRELHIIDSERMDQIRPEEMKQQVAQADIFARVSPARKLRVVQALQACGEVVAMTGDGINDGPALQAADVGIAMGVQGTDLARSAADVVLKDDRLETVLDAIREGRTITGNIRKSLHFLIASNIGEIMTVFGAIAAGAAPPLTPMQLLWLNLLSDVLPAVAFAAEPPEEDVMRQPPRDAAKPMIGKAELLQYTREGIYLSGGTLASYFYGIARHGPGARAGTIAFNSMILGSLLHALSCRSERRSAFSAGQEKRNKQMDLALGASLGLQLLVNLVPGLRRLLGIARPGVMDVVAILAGAGVPLLLNEAAKGAAAGRRKRQDRI